jgi:hypothetical protein
MLSNALKRRFEARLISFIIRKKFIPRNFSEVTEEMKIRISASAVQLTFGLPEIYLSHFDYIIIYPDRYYSEINKTYHQGEVNPRYRAIVLSWKDFDDTSSINDGRNLGLHEMAHALHLENTIRNDEFEFLPEKALKNWDIACKEEIKMIRSGLNTFFRSYAGTDEFEFFASAVEVFFENPTAFQNSKPALYQLLTELLKQDPLALDT